MARAALEHALPPSAVDALFRDIAEPQYTRTLLFSDVVDLLALVVCKVRPSINCSSRPGLSGLHDAWGMRRGVSHR